MMSQLVIYFSHSRLSYRSMYYCTASDGEIFLRKSWSDYPEALGLLHVHMVSKEQYKMLVYRASYT